MAKTRLSNNTEAEHIKRRAERQREYERQRQQYERIVSDAARTIHRRLFRVPPEVPLYLYYKPSGPKYYAILHAFTEQEVELHTEENGNATGPFAPHGADPMGKDAPGAWILATPERVPTSFDAAQLYAWLKAITDWLPMYPAGEERAHV